MAERTVEYEVAVVGLGAMGSQTLWALSRRGVRAVGIEQFEPGHDRGSSHGGSRIIRTAYMEGPGYVPLVRHARALWQQLEHETGASLLRPGRALYVGPGTAPAVTGTLAAAHAHGVPVELLSAAELRHRWPQHLIGDGLVGVAEEEAGILDPERAVRCAVRAARGHGATVLTGTAVVGLARDGAGTLLDCGGTRVRAGHVVVAAGAWLGRLLPAAGAALRVTRKVVGWFATDDPGGYAPGRFPVFLRDDGDGGPVWYGFPTLDGATVKIAAHSGPGTAEPADPVAGVRPPGAADARLLAGLAGRLRGLGREPARMQACMYTMTPDEHFVVGQRADLPGLTLLGGFSGHGFKFATALGEAAADLATTGRTDAPIGQFDPHRFDG